MKKRSKLVALLTAGLVVPGVLGGVGFPSCVGLSQIRARQPRDRQRQFRPLSNPRQ